jgi:hypothetical protein
MLLGSGVGSKFWDAVTSKFEFAPATITISWVREKGAWSAVITL